MKHLFWMVRGQEKPDIAFDAIQKVGRSILFCRTRAAVDRVGDELSDLGMMVATLHGGLNQKQRKAFSSGVDIIVACPGRLEDLLENDYLTLEDVAVVVIDEADRMADMGFMEPVCRILDQCAPDRQTILFSATLDDDVALLVDKYQNDPVTIEVGPKQVSMESMKHLFWMVRGQEKPDIAFDAIQKVGRSILFCRTRAAVDRVGDELSDLGMMVATLHGGLNQKQRENAMKRFTTSRAKVLIATDVAARGIDIEGVHCVIHYDPPENGKAYKHRSGRTARAGSIGTVLSIVQNPQRRQYQRLQRDVGIRCDFEPPKFEDLPANNFELIASDDRRERGSRGDRGNSRRGGRGNDRGNSNRWGDKSGGRRGGSGGGGGGKWYDQKRNNSGGSRKPYGGSGGGGGQRSSGGGGQRSSGGSSDGGDSETRKSSGRQDDRGGRHDRRNSHYGRNAQGHTKNKDGGNRSGGGGRRSSGSRFDKGKSNRSNKQGSRQGR
jgi:superfamily II DNA/RNA helicase